MALAGAGCRGIEELPDEILLAILACKPSFNPIRLVPIWFLPPQFCMTPRA